MKYFKYLGLIILIFVFNFSTVNASGNYRISLSATSVSKGKSVSLYIKGNSLIGGFTISSSNSSVATVSNSSVWIENNTEIIKVNTINTGNTTITVTPTTVSDDSGNDLSLGAKTLTLVVTDTTNNNNQKSDEQTNIKKSNDASLKSLSIDDINLNPEFKSDILEYKAEAKAGTEKVKINATCNDNKANVSGTGEVSVSDGINKLEVIVAAEDGTTKTYVINLNVKEFEPIEVKIKNKKYTVIRKKDDLPEVDLFEDKKIKIGNEEVDGYYNDKLKIYLVGLKDDKGNINMYVYEPEDNSYKLYKWVTVGGVTLYINNPPTRINNFKKYHTVIKNTKVDIYKLSRKEKIGLLYGINVATGNKGYYLYDKEEETLSRYYNKEVDLVKQKYDKTNNILMIIMGIVASIIIIIILISLIMGKKKRKRTRR